MRVCVVSQDELTTVRVRQALLQQGHDCPAAQVLKPDLAAAQLSQQRPDLVVVILSPKPEQVLPYLSEVRALTRGRLLAVGPTADSRLVLSALRSGAEDYVELAEVETELGAALDRLSSQSSLPQEVGRVIAVLAPNGGSGSSTLAANIAIVLAREHKQALLIDLKLEAGDLAALLDLKPAHTLADLCQNAARMDRVMFERSLVSHDSGLQLLASPQALADIRYVTADGVRQALSLSRSLFPYVVADLDHSFREEQTQVIRQADVILLVFRLEFAALRNVRRTLEYLETLGISRDRVRLVVNRYGQPKEVPAAKAEESLGIKIAHYVPDDPKSINRANNNGVPVVLEAPSCKVARSMAQLAASVNGQHKGK
jgi:pilus assembly protein CpaE